MATSDFSIMPNKNIYKTAENTVFMKCEICDKKIEMTFLSKIMGTHVKDSKGKKHIICFECQKKFDSKDGILGAMKL